MREAWQKAEDEAANDENDGVWNPRALGESGKAGDEKEEKQKCDFDVVEAGGLRGGAGRNYRRRAIRQRRILFSRASGLG